MSEAIEQQLRCRACAWRRVCGFQGAVHWLRSLNMLKRNTRPDPALVAELLRSASGKLKCPGCGALGLIVEDAEPENPEDWGEARACERCRKPIDRERLEIAPHTRLCIACQRAEERGEGGGAAQYCARCGGILQVRPAGGPGVARYVMKCSSCGRTE